MYILHTTLVYRLFYIKSMALSFLSRDPLELSHISSRDRRAVECEVLDPCDVTTILIVFYKQLHILNTLELHKPQGHRVAF